MKKIVLLGVTIFSIFTLAACGANKSEASFLNVSNLIAADDSGTALIKGKTTPNKKIQLECYSDTYSMSTKSDEKGNFIFKYAIKTNHDTVDVVLGTGRNRISKNIHIELNSDVKKSISDSQSSSSVSESKSESESQSESASSSAAEAAKEKAAADATAKEEADKKNPATYPQVAYDEMARNGDKHIGEKIQITGKVLQAMDSDDGGATLRVGTSEDGYDDIYLVTIDSDTWAAHRLLEDDTITIYGTVDGLESYDSTMGGKITKPEITAVFY